ncbi:MAG TPA: lipocalin-like domain-containing protein [Bryobacteraceae bacterium]|nr:lipocalin-like domain-containing protein [Bryobacteraceae bacterium]
MKSRSQEPGVKSQKFAAAVVVLCAAGLMAASAYPYRLALPGYQYQFPRDYFNHPEYRTEWWYYTGNLHTQGGRRFGFELTFFRQGADRDPGASGVWDVRDVWPAHLALSDIDGNRFFQTERLNRAGAGLAGADLPQGRVWNGNWQVQWKLDAQAPAGFASQQLQAVADGFALKLSMTSPKPPVINGQNGVSQKAAGAGRASHYISLTRLVTHGTVTLDGKDYTVDGLSWMDHEFFTHQLEPNQVGWDWISLQLNDGSEIMLFRLRRKDGSVDPYSAGTYVDPRGKSKFLDAGAFSLTPGKIWTSPSTHGRYPIEWTVRIPSLGIEAVIATRLPQQEMSGTAPYWEGAVDAIGVKEGGSLMGSGYLEMTGYAGRAPLSD